MMQLCYNDVYKHYVFKNETENGMLEVFLKNGDIKIKESYIDSECTFKSIRDAIKTAKKFNLKFEDITPKYSDFD